VSPYESTSFPTTSDTTPTTSEDEDTPANPPKRSWVKHNHPPQQLLGTIDERCRLRSRVIQPTSEVANQVSYSYYLAQTKPKKVDEALQDEGWVSTMHDELHQFTRNDVWTLVPILQNRILLVQSGSSRIKQISMVLWFEIKPVLLHRDILKYRE
jgi:hypothetical protein